MSLRHVLPFALVLSALLAGCVGDASSADVAQPIGPRREVRDTPVAPAAAATLRQVLARPRTLAVDGESATGAIVVRYQSDDAAHPIELTVRSGHLTVGLAEDGNLEIRGLSLAFEDIASAPLWSGAETLQLTDVRATMHSPVRCQPFFTTSDDALVCETRGDVELAWALRLEDGRAWPLEPQTLEQVQVSLHVFLREDDRVGLDLETTTAREQAWSIADFAELSRFSLVAEAVEIPVLH